MPTEHCRDGWRERIRHEAFQAPAAIAATAPGANFLIGTAGEFLLFIPRLYRPRSNLGVQLA